MKWRWLLMDYTDPLLPLSRWQRFNAAMKLVAHWRFSLLDYGLMLLSLAPFAIGLGFRLARPKFLASFGPSAPLVVYVVCLVLSVIIALYVSKWIYARPVRRACRQMGYDVCVECGYWLRGLGDEVRNCPECGAARAALPQSGAKDSP